MLLRSLRNLLRKMIPMRPGAGILLPLMLVGAPVLASTYTISAPHLAMHVGDPVPPLIFQVSSYPGSYASHFSGEPGRATTATPSSRAGEYPIVVSQGSLKLLDKADEVHFVNGTLSVLAKDLIGARLHNGVRYPPGFFSAPQYPILDVTKNTVANLVGDGVTDNAEAFAKLLSQNGVRVPTTTTNAPPLMLYFPPGVYATSQPLTIYGKFWTFYGSGPQTSVLKLLPNSAAFNVSGAPPVQFFSPQSVHGNENFHDYIFNLGVEIGPGNPNAIPFTTEQNNSGAERNVQIWADDSACPYALSVRRAYPGPLLLKDVAIYGCAAALSSNQNEYNVTAEGLTTEGQTKTAIDDQGLKLSIRHWLSDNRGAALRASGSATNVALLDSALLGGEGSTPAIASLAGSSVYVKNVVLSGYSESELSSTFPSGRRLPGRVVQAWTGTPQSLFERAGEADSLHLPENETPEPVDPAPVSWTQLSNNTKEWPSEISSSASPTVYAAPGTYAASGAIQVTVPDKVNHLEFFQSKFPTGNPQMILTVAGGSRTPLVIDGCIYESCQIVHTGSRTVVLRDTTLRSYTSQQGAGDLYIEDAVMGAGDRGTLSLHFYSSQHIWARQLNLEQAHEDKFDCSGCTLWILGYKTEQASTSVVLTDGAKAEIFGFFFYQNVAPTAEGSASIQLKDSSLFATGWTKVDTPGRGQPNWVNESARGKTSSLPTHDVNSSQQLTMFYSFSAGKSPNREDPSHAGKPTGNQSPQRNEVH